MARWVKRQFLAHLFRSLPDAICSRLNFADEENRVADEILTRSRYGEAFWRAHHEAWRRSELNQREYCEAQGIPLKAVRQLAGEVQGRASAVGAQAALPTRRVKSHP
jgi:hypothetical protein